MKNNLYFRILAVMVTLVLAAGVSRGQAAMASGEFSLQGHLTTSNGTPISDGAHTLIANVYAKGSGQLVYTETDNITTTGGIFSSMIGANGVTKMAVDASGQYVLGVAIDNEAEMTPRIDLASSLKSLTADVAANANAVGGFGVSTNDNAKANTLLVLNNQGKIDAGLIDSGIVTGINGIKGSVNLMATGDLAVSTYGNTVGLSFTGTSGSLNYPYTHSVSISSGSAFTLTNTMSASTASFINIGAGMALSAQAASGSAISAASSGTANGAATIDIQNSGGAALNAVSTVAGDAVVKLQNKSSAANAKLLTAFDEGGSTVLDIASGGKTTINSASADALDVTSTAAGEAAVKVTGGLKLIGPAGVGVVQMGQLQTTINNAFCKPNSIILITVNGGGINAVPLQVIGQNNGAFVVAAFNGAAALAGNVTFSYLIINQ
ncbi:MAG TPA: hypothetical protein VEW28_01045 [Candidatus Kapabacteria bacterium]|nr:hypothetical protein [Candidatus Kapabacteria bacterium]